MLAVAAIWLANGRAWRWVNSLTFSLCSPEAVSNCLEALRMLEILRPALRFAPKYAPRAAPQQSMGWWGASGGVHSVGAAVSPSE